MDEQSLQYLTVTHRKLQALAELSDMNSAASALIVDELKRLGYKPKTVGDTVICDVGRGKKRLAFHSELCDMSVHYDIAMQAAILLNVARIVGVKSDVPLRLIFGSVSDIANSGILDGVSESYALRPSTEIAHGKIGYCYGVMCAGCCEFDIDFCGKSEDRVDVKKSAEYVAEQSRALAGCRSVSVTLCNTADVKYKYTVLFYDFAACEGFMIDLERAALNADDSNGTTHTVIATKVYPPLVNHALAVDKVRSIMKEKCVAVPPNNTSDSFSDILKETTGCMVWLGAGQGGQTESALVGTELIIKLIESFKA